MVNLRFLTSTSRLRPDCVLTENSKIVIWAQTKKWRMTGYRHSKSKIWVMNRVFVQASELNFLCEIFFRFFGQRNRLTSVNSRPHTAVVSYDVLFKVLGILNIFGALFSEPQNLSQISLRLFFAQMNFLIFRTCPDCKKSDSFYPVIFHNYFLVSFTSVRGAIF